GSGVLRFLLCCCACASPRLLARVTRLRATFWPVPVSGPSRRFALASLKKRYNPSSVSHNPFDTGGESNEGTPHSVVVRQFAADRVRHGLCPGPEDDGSRPGQRSGTQGSRYHSQDFAGEGILPRADCHHATP